MEGNQQMPPAQLMPLKMLLQIFCVELFPPQKLPLLEQELAQVSRD